MARELNVNDVVFKIMVIGDFIAMFTLFAVFLCLLHLIVAKIKPSLLYHDVDDFGVVSRLKEMVRNRQASKTVSFGDEAIYEEPKNIYEEQRSSVV